MMIKRTLAFAVCLVLMLSITAPAAMASDFEPLAPNCETCGLALCVCDAAEPSEATENTDLSVNTRPCLTITASGSINKGQALLFKISGVDFESVVALHNNSSLCIEGLTLGGTYNIEPLGNWSWRYTISPSYATVTIQADSGQNVLNFSVSKSNYNWLSSESYGVF